MEGIVADVNPLNAEELLAGHDVILDGVDNFETRFLVNDFAVKSSRPWIYAAVVASYGLTMTIRPGITPCLACLLPMDRSGQGLEETCDTIGVLGPIVNLVASLEVAEAMRLHSRTRNRPKRSPGVVRRLDRSLQSVRVQRDLDCPVCVRREFTHLDGEAQPHITMCGRDSVQIHEQGRAIDLALLKTRLSPTVEEVRQNDFSASAFRRTK